MTTDSAQPRKESDVVRLAIRPEFSTRQLAVQPVSLAGCCDRATRLDACVASLGRNLN